MSRVLDGLGKTEKKVVRDRSVYTNSRHVVVKLLKNGVVKVVRSPLPQGRFSLKYKGKDVATIDVTFIRTVTHPDDLKPHIDDAPYRSVEKWFRDSLRRKRSSMPMCLYEFRLVKYFPKRLDEAGISMEELV